jgi:hypothetical protein
VFDLLKYEWATHRGIPFASASETIFRRPGDFIRLVVIFFSSVLGFLVSTLGSLTGLERSTVSGFGLCGLIAIDAAVLHPASSELDVHLREII